MWVLIAIGGLGSMAVLAILATLAGGRYEGQHVLDDVQAEWDAYAAERGSMILAEEHPLEPLPAPVVDAHPWLEQTAADLAPEVLEQARENTRWLNEQVRQTVEAGGGEVNLPRELYVLLSEDESEREEIVLPAYGGWVSGPCLDPGPGDAAVEPPASPGPAEMSESDWTAPPVANPRAEDMGARAGRGGVATATPTPAPPPSPWLAEQLDVLRAWSEWQQQKMAVLA